MQNFRSPQPGIVFVTILLGKEMRQPRASNSACPGNKASAKEKDEKHVIKQSIELIFVIPQCYSKLPFQKTRRQDEGRDE